MRKKRVILVSLVSLSMLVLLGVGIKFFWLKLNASTDSSSSVPSVYEDKTVPVCSDASKYSIQTVGEYTVDQLSADDYPDYYGGRYIDENGKLIVCIKDTYYEKDYQHSDWYRVLSRSLGSEDFDCRFVKYNYTEMINGCSALLYGSTGEEIQEKGIGLVDFGINSQKNCLEVGVRTEKDVELIKELLGEEMYEIEVVGDREYVLD